MTILCSEFACFYCRFLVLIAFFESEKNKAVRSPKCLINGTQLLGYLSRVESYSLIICREDAVNNFRLAH